MFTLTELLKASAGRLISGSQEAGLSGISIDSRTIKKGEVFIAIKGNNFDGHNFIAAALQKGAGAVIVQYPSCVMRRPRGISFISVKDTIKALGDIAGSRRRKFDIPLIAVTGSNGKTTTKEMVAKVLAKKYKVLKNIGTQNNHIGLPLALAELDNSFDIAVVEIGTNHFGEVKYLSAIASPNIGIITNIAPSHLEYLRNLRGVFAEKYSLIKNLQSPYIALLNADDPFLKREAAGKRKRPLIFTYAVKNKSDFRAENIARDGARVSFTAAKYKFTLASAGYYNIYNALSAIAIGRLFGIEYADIKRALDLFDFPQGRLRLIELNKIKFIDDTYNANPLSLQQALEALKGFKVAGRKILVMADMLELGKKEEELHLRAGREVAKVCDLFISVGRLARLTAEAARRAGLPAKNIFRCSLAGEARDILLQKIAVNPADIVLVKGSRAMKMEEIFKS